MLRVDLKFARPKHRKARVTPCLERRRPQRDLREGKSVGCEVERRFGCMIEIASERAGTRSFARTQQHFGERCASASASRSAVALHHLSHDAVDIAQQVIRFDEDIAVASNSRMVAAARATAARPSRRDPLRPPSPKGSQ